MNSEKNKKKNFLSKISDNKKALIFRWWISGAVCFFIGWGTSLGTRIDSYDLIFVLGLVTGLAHLIIYNPIVFGMFEIERDGKIVNKKYYERTILEGTYVKLAEIMKSIFSVIFVSLTYFLVNILYSIIFNKPETFIFLPLEPVLYATLFIAYYTLFTKIARLIVKLFTKIFKKEKIEN